MIYFLRRPNGDIKIGTTIRLSARKDQIEKEQGTTVEVLAVTKGSFVEERILHEKFADYWVGNEWFRPSEQLMEFLKQECYPWDGTDEVDAVDIRLRVDPDLHQRIQDAADQDGNSVAAFIRTAVAKEMKRREREGR